tara:strand:- start:4358 stop:5110 length:753 start_codon:yes stop_codon:yes gene_type:complete
MFYSRKLKKFREIKHCFFSRNGGFSKGFYKSLNCGRGSMDFKNNISKNLGYVSKKMGVKPYNLILMHQTHSNKVLEITKKNIKNKIVSDAMVTKINKIALGVVTADCVPILIYDSKRRIVGCIHAGWKGAFSGIIKNTITKIRKLEPNNDIYASIGPCIGEKSYEVDLKFFKKFVNKSQKNKKYFSNKNKNKKLFNLRKFVADKLLELKVKIDHVNHDTFKETNNFFSFRRTTILKQKDYGRCISIIKLI